jgi:hypothetical protein
MQSTTSNASAYPRIHNSSYAPSDAGLGLTPASGGLLSDNSGGGRDGSRSSSSSSQITGVTELVRSSVNFRGELQQLLAMLGTAETEAAQGVGFLERQIEAAAKVCCRGWGLMVLLQGADACIVTELLLLSSGCVGTQQKFSSSRRDRTRCAVLLTSHYTSVSQAALTVYCCLPVAMCSVFPLLLAGGWPWVICHHPPVWQAEGRGRTAAAADQATHGEQGPSVVGLMDKGYKQRDSSRSSSAW